MQVIKVILKSLYVATKQLQQKQHKVMNEK